MWTYIHLLLQSNLQLPLHQEHILKFDRLYLHCSKAQYFLYQERTWWSQQWFDSVWCKTSVTANTFTSLRGKNKDNPSTSNCSNKHVRNCQHGMEYWNTFPSPQIPCTKTTIKFSYHYQLCQQVHQSGFQLSNSQHVTCDNFITHTFSSGDNLPYIAYSSKRASQTELWRDLFFPEWN